MNRKNLSIVLAAGALLLALPAMANPLPVERVQLSSALGAYDREDLNAKPNLNLIVCRYEPPPTGTRIGGWRECEPQRYWNGIPHHVRTLMIYGGGI